LSRASGLVGGIEDCSKTAGRFFALEIPVALLSQRAYARYRGVAVSAVQKAINRGRISTQPDGRVDSETADSEWLKNTALYNSNATKHRVEEHNASAFGVSQYTKARAIREHYQARLAKLEYQERVGELLAKDEVEAATFDMFRQFRDRLLNICDRVAAMLAAETDAGRCHDILAAEIRVALETFADSND
jgi:hypothetical protein